VSYINIALKNVCHAVAGPEGSQGQTFMRSADEQCDCNRVCDVFEWGVTDNFVRDRAIVTFGMNKPYILEEYGMAVSATSYIWSHLRPQLYLFLSCSLIIAHECMTRVRVLLSHAFCLVSYSNLSACSAPPGGGIGTSQPNTNRAGAYLELVAHASTDQRRAGVGKGHGGSWRTREREREEFLNKDAGWMFRRAIFRRASLFWKCCMKLHRTMEPAACWSGRPSSGKMAKATLARASTLIGQPQEMATKLCKKLSGL
jgi:hypothetical protein